MGRLIHSLHQRAKLRRCSDTCTHPGPSSHHLTAYGRWHYTRKV